MLTVLSVAYPLAPVGPDAVGGAEQVLSALDHALVAAGHRSIVIAPDGSTAAGELITTPAVPTGHIDDATCAVAHEATRRAIAAVLDDRAIDVMHFHGIDFHAYLPSCGPPALATLHLRAEWYPEAALVPPRPDTWLNYVSATQHRALLARIGRPAPWVLPPIANGVPVAALGRSRHARRDFALMLGRICPEKGQHVAIAAARAARAPLLIAGQVFPYPEHLVL